MHPGIKQSPPDKIAVTPKVSTGPKNANTTAIKSPSPANIKNIHKSADAGRCKTWPSLMLTI